MNHTRTLAAFVLGAVLITPVSAGAVSPAGLSGVDGLSAIELVQDKPKSETIERKVKRAWRKLTGHKFEVSCLFSRTTCTETGKSREDARAKCQAQHPLCQVR